MDNYIKIPKYISQNEYDLDSDKFIEYDVKKLKDKYLLIEKDDFENESQSFWFIDDIARTVLSKQGKCVFALVSMNDKNIEIFLGNTIEIDNVNYFSYSSDSLKEMGKIRKTINTKIDFLKNILNYNDDVIVYASDVNEDIIKDLFGDTKKIYKQKEFNYLLSKTKFHQKRFYIYLPYVVVSIISFSIFLTINYFINSHNEKLESEFNSARTKINLETKKYNDENLILKTKISDERNKLENTNLISEELYKGEE
jgi:hypothetical protein